MIQIQSAGTVENWQGTTHVEEQEKAPEHENIVVDATRAQLQHFMDSDPRCRALQLPDGIMLRYTLFESLYFYLRTGVKDGKISTRVFATDSPYDRQKTAIGEVITPMFEPQADLNHFQKLQRLLYGWVEFIKKDTEGEEGFKSFTMDERPQ